MSLSDVFVALVAILFIANWYIIKLANCLFLANFDLKYCTLKQ